jgi:hypothetical protein
LDPSSYARVKQEADRAIPPVALIMLISAALGATLAFLCVLWAWNSDIPDWAFDAISLLPDPVLALAIAAAYLWGRERLKRRVVAAFSGDPGYEVFDQAARRGALKRFQIALLVFAIVLFVLGELYLSWISGGTYFWEDEDPTDPTTSA